VPVWAALAARCCCRRPGFRLPDQIDQVRFAQFLLFRQAQQLKEHARARGVRLIGDLPFFVSPDSSDVWANPELFLLDEQYRPRFVAGVPPDYFSATGQLWGNPVYDWDAVRPTGYRWCIDRLRALLTYVDAVRLDHFRGFAAAWHVPAGAATAQSGQWVPGPGAEFFKVVNGYALNTLRSALDYIARTPVERIEIDRGYLADLTAHELAAERKLTAQVLSFFVSVRERSGLARSRAGVEELKVRATHRWRGMDSNFQYAEAV
jgi:4-alpha-glucanotransferase